MQKNRDAGKLQLHKLYDNEKWQNTQQTEYYSCYCSYTSQYLNF